MTRFTLEELVHMLGDESAGDLNGMNIFYNKRMGLPDSFDSREAWGSCVHPIRNQESCGSCWSFGSTEALSDRFCVASDGAVDVVLSPQDLVSCNKQNSGCGGGNIQYTWDYLEKYGAVSDACMPYTSGDGDVAQCQLSCTVEGEEWSKYKCVSGSVYVAKTYDDIKSYLMEGPLDVNFKVYEDFYNYDSGVYVHTTGSYLGGHAVKLVGWGVDDSGLEYWTIANSWGPAWGEKGYFRIAFGQCEVDDIAYGCDPELADHLAFTQ
mmetsp:Transcript_13301/g.9603  ORF Transcript_13301/g.9603 Transcript_13301/m.9603 type:complete len:265 (-) Transcript_13301:39-833(-)